MSKFDYSAGKGDFAGTINRYKVDGMLAAVATTASTQATGTGATVIRVNEGGGLIRMPDMGFSDADLGYVVDEDGAIGERAATADTILANQAAPSFLLNGEFRRITRVAYLHLTNGIQFANAYGTAAASAVLALEPTTAQIEAAIENAAMPWLKVYGVLVERTGDTAVTATIDNLNRPMGIFGRREIFTSAI